MTWIQQILVLVMESLQMNEETNHNFHLKYKFIFLNKSLFLWFVVYRIKNRETEKEKLLFLQLYTLDTLISPAFCSF